MNEITLLANLAGVLPSICEALLTCDDMMRHHEHIQKLKYADHQSLEDIYYLYKSGRISHEVYVSTVRALTQPKQHTLRLPFE